MRIKIVIFTIFITILLPVLTYASFIDKEISKSTFSSTKLNIDLLPTNEFTNIITDTNPIVIEYTIKNTGDITTANKIYISDITNQIFTSKIYTTIILNGLTTIYSEYLTDLDTGIYTYQSTNTTNTLTFLFSISADNFQNTPGETTTLTIKNYSGQVGAQQNKGYFDYENITVTISNPLPLPLPQQLLLPENKIQTDILDILLND